MVDEWEIVANLPPRGDLSLQIREQTEAYLRNGGRICTVEAGDNAEARFCPTRTRAQALSDMKRANYRGANR